MRRQLYSNDFLVFLLMLAPYGLRNANVTNAIDKCTK
jgi:hypothetical protein